MNKMRFAAVALLSALCLLMTSVAPLAQTPEEGTVPVKATADFRYNRAIAERMTALGGTAARNGDSAGDPLPTAYSSVTQGYMTPVKDQGDFGGCWAFSAIACAETATLRNGLTNDPAPDYSELALMYFTYNTVTDPIGGLAGDTITFEGGDYLDAGGNTAMSAMSLGSWRGVTEESLVPYTAAEANRSYRPADSLSYRDVLHLENAEWLTLSTDADRDAVKRRLLEYGAADVSIYYNESYYNARQHCYYTDRSDYTNHAVVLCGWDDNYPASNFAGSFRRVRPTQNGAWLMRNSWSDTWGDDGYFWVSYYDAALCKDVAAFYRYAAVDHYDYNYQYDGVASGQYLEFSDSKIYTANLFVARHDEELRAVSNYYYNTPGGTYTARVYTGVKNPSDPTSGTLAATVTGTYDAMGLKTDELPTPVTLTAGTRFSVVYEQCTPSTSEKAAIMASMDYDHGDGYTRELGYNDGALGQSFYSTNGRSWSDLFDPEEELYASLRIHAYTKLPGGGEEPPDTPSDPEEPPVTNSDVTSDVTSDDPSDPSDPPDVPSDDPSDPSEPSESSDPPISDLSPDPSADPPLDPSAEPPSDSSETPDDRVPGDADGDGQVSMKDVLLIRKHIAGLGTTIDEHAADVNGDGSVDMKDVLLIRKFIAGILTRLPKH